MKKILIITYYWPPSGGGGVQRWLKFAKYLPNYNWKPIVVTPENPDFDTIDKTLVEEIPEECEELKLPIWEPYSAYRKVSGNKSVKQGISDNKDWKQRLFNWLRGNLFIPDPRVFWVRSTSKFLTNYLRDRPVDVVVTTGPPHSMHLIGLRLKKKLGIKWLADFRDPWSDWDMLDNFHVGVLARWQHQRLEKRVLQGADQILTVSNTWATELEEKFDGKVNVITNGFDESDFEELHLKKNSSIVFGHFGLLNSFRNPSTLWSAFKTLAENQVDFKVQLYGPVDNLVKQDIESNNLAGYVNFAGTVSHNEVLKKYQECEVLLLLLNDSKNASGHLPGKLFEYIRSGVPILAIGMKDGDAARILEKTGTGQVFSTNDETGITEFINQIVQGSLTLERNNEAIEEYSRKVLTGRLSKLLEEMI